jgi:hypothetical protein
LGVFITHTSRVLKGKSRGFIPDAPNQPKGLRALCLGRVLEGEAEFAAAAGSGALLANS